jgi:tetratricopeptide (TPR) repeat protein
LYRVQAAAEAALNEKQYAAAIPHLKKIIELQPESGEAHYNLALSQAHQGDFEEASKNIEKAIQLKPDEESFKLLKQDIEAGAGALRARTTKEIEAEADKLVEQKNYSAALQKYEETRSSAPPGYDLTSVWAKTARTAAKLNQEPQMADAYRKAIELAPDKAQYISEFAQYYFDQKEFAKGVQVYVDLYEPSSLEKELLDRGQRFMRKGNEEAGKVTFEKILEINPEHVEAHYEIGLIYYYEDQDFPKAKTALSKYVEVGEDEDHLNTAKAILMFINKNPSSQ